MAFPSADTGPRPPVPYGTKAHTLRQICQPLPLPGQGHTSRMLYFNFMFPPGSQRVNLLLEGPLEVNLFCREFVERAEVMFILSTISALIVIMSLVHFLMALSANYAHIRGYDKFTDLKVI